MTDPRNEVRLLRSIDISAVWPPVPDADWPQTQPDPATLDTLEFQASLDGLAVEITFAIVDANGAPQAMPSDVTFSIEIVEIVRPATPRNAPGQPFCARGCSKDLVQLYDAFVAKEIGQTELALRMTNWVGADPAADRILVYMRGA